VNTEEFKRRLTAILSADVEGYSRLMREDEDATIRTLTSYRSAIALDFPCQSRRGEITMGILKNRFRRKSEKRARVPACPTCGKEIAIDSESTALLRELGVRGAGGECPKCRAKWFHDFKTGKVTKNYS